MQVAPVASRNRYSWAWEEAGVRAVGMHALAREKKTGVARKREGHALGLVTRRARPAGTGPLCQNEPDSRPGGPCILGPGLVLLLGYKLGLNNGLEWVLEPNKIRKRRITTKRDSR